MKNKLILWVAMMLVCMTGMARASENLLPRPQQVTVSGGNFRMGKIKLNTPVWQEEWENFIVQAGGKLTDKATKHITVTLVPQV